MYSPKRGGEGERKHSSVRHGHAVISSPFLSPVGPLGTHAHVPCMFFRLLRPGFKLCDLVA